MSATLFYDGFCPYCTATARAVRRLDLLRRIRVVSFRHSAEYAQYGITAEALEEAMHLVLHHAGGHTVYRGYAAVVGVVRQLPPLWISLPLLWLLGAVGLGDRVYRWLAANRIIVPDSQHCADGACPLPSSNREELL